MPCPQRLVFAAVSIRSISASVRYSRLRSSALGRRLGLKLTLIFIARVTSRLFLPMNRKERVRLLAYRCHSQHSRWRLPRWKRFSGFNMTTHIDRVLGRDLMPDSTSACDNRFAVKPAVSFDPCHLDSIALSANERRGLAVFKRHRAHMVGDRIAGNVTAVGLNPSAPMRRHKTPPSRLQFGGRLGPTRRDRNARSISRPVFVNRYRRCGSGTSGTGALLSKADV
jgi:hypothetical protein